MEKHAILVTRRVSSVFGFTLLEWSCALRARLSGENPSAYFLDFGMTGSWDPGASILVSPTYHADLAVLELRVTEQFPGRSARSTRLFFQVEAGVPISLIEGRS